MSYAFELIEHVSYRHTVVIEAETEAQAEEILKNFNGEEDARIAFAGVKYLGSDFEPLVRL